MVPLKYDVVCRGLGNTAGGTAPPLGGEGTILNKLKTCVPPIGCGRVIVGVRPIVEEGVGTGLLQMQ